MKVIWNRIKWKIKLDLEIVPGIFDFPEVFADSCYQQGIIQFNSFFRPNSCSDIVCDPSRLTVSFYLFS